MHRLKSIDNFRAITMIMMLWVHLRVWWLRDIDQWFVALTLPFTDRVFACAFLIIAGASSTLFTRTRLLKVNKMEHYNLRTVKKEYYLRALFIFIVAICYNSIVAIMFMNPLIIWKWFLLLTTSVSLMLMWPLMRFSKTSRIILAITLWILNYYLFSFLSGYEGQLNTFGFLYYFLYHSLDQDPIFFTFSFFLLGSVVGDIIMDINSINNNEERRIALKKRFLYPSVIVGLILIGIGLIFEYPNYNSNQNFSWIAFPIGFNLVLLVVLIVLEEYKIVNFKTNFRFFRYFSYYSLTIFFSHNLLYFLFCNLLNVINMWIIIPSSILLYSIVMHFIYNSKWKENISIKFLLGKIVKELVDRKGIKRKKEIPKITQIILTDKI
ncbi:MAG: hypothetical protein ACFE96_08360 [Candidatus Hermodarchaeota archaeon]